MYMLISLANMLFEVICCLCTKTPPYRMGVLLTTLVDVVSFMYDGVNLDSWSDGGEEEGLILKLFPAVSGGYRVL